MDTAVFAGLRDAYALTVASATIVVADSVAVRDGTDTLRNIERLKFTDVSVAFDVAGSAGQAYRLYQAAFDRVPDLAGLGHQMKALDDGLALSQVANNFLRSPEFSSRYGSLTDAQFVSQLYLNVLHRPAEAAGFNYHTANLANGTNTRADVVAGFSESPENQAAVIGTIQNGMAYTV